MANGGTVTFLDTNKFSSAISTFKSGIEEYNTIKNGVERTSNSLFANWAGKGKTQFEKDYTTIYQQLADIADILYELYDALVDAQSVYIQADEEAAKMLNINSGS